MRLSSIDPSHIAIECGEELPRDALALPEAQQLAMLFNIACRKIAEARQHHTFGFARRPGRRPSANDQTMSPTDVGPAERLPPSP